MGSKYANGSNGGSNPVRIKPLTDGLVWGLWGDQGVSPDYEQLYHGVPMDARIAKIIKHRGLSEAIATLLVEAGFTPREVKAASDEELLAIDGIGEVTLSTIRAAIPTPQ